MALSIIKALKDIAGVTKNLSSLNNTHLRNIYTVTSQYGKWFDVTSLTLPKGYDYLLLGHTAANLDGTSILNCAISGATFGGAGKSTLKAGGGCFAWGIVEATDADTIVKLRSYGYQNASYTITGKILAIRLGKFLGGGTE